MDVWVDMPDGDIGPMIIPFPYLDRLSISANSEHTTLTKWRNVTAIEKVRNNLVKLIDI